MATALKDALQQIRRIEFTFPVTLISNNKRVDESFMLFVKRVISSTERNEEYMTIAFADEVLGVDEEEINKYSVITDFKLKYSVRTIVVLDDEELSVLILPVKTDIVKFVRDLVSHVVILIDNNKNMLVSYIRYIKYQPYNYVLKFLANGRFADEFPLLTQYAEILISEIPHISLLQLTDLLSYLPRRLSSDAVDVINKYNLNIGNNLLFSTLDLPPSTDELYSIVSSVTNSVLGDIEFIGDTLQKDEIFTEENRLSAATTSNTIELLKSVANAKILFYDNGKFSALSHASINELESKQDLFAMCISNECIVTTRTV